QEPECDHNAHEVCSNHHRATRPAIDEGAGKRSEKCVRHESRKQDDRGDFGCCVRHNTDQPECGNEVKPVAQFRDDLPDPQSSERAIAPQKLHVSQRVHGRKPQYSKEAIKKPPNCGGSRSAVRSLSNVILQQIAAASFLEMPRRPLQNPSFSLTESASRALNPNAPACHSWRWPRA